MGQGEEVKKKPDPKVEIQERGEIFFFYRPRVNKEEAHSADDVQRLYIVLRPESGERPVEEKQAPDSGKEGVKISKRKDKDEENDEAMNIARKEKPAPLEKKETLDSGNGEKISKRKKKDEKNDEAKNVSKKHKKQLGSEGGHGSEVVNIEKQPLLRFIVMGKKSLPDPSERSRPYWGFVEIVTTNVDDIKMALKGEEYDTATRGHRHRPSARALAEGVYRILRHEAGNNRIHTHLIYKLEFPPYNAENEPQESLNIEHEASFIIQIKNPEQGVSSGWFRGLQTKRKALYPASLQSRMGRYHFVPADPPDYLNFEGCEFLLISASDDLEEELGLELKVEVEETRAEKSCSDLIKMFGEECSSRPLLSGTWV